MPDSGHALDILVCFLRDFFMPDFLETFFSHGTGATSVSALTSSGGHQQCIWNVLLSNYVNNDNNAVFWFIL